MTTLRLPLLLLLGVLWLVPAPVWAKHDGT